ncbi:MAG: 3-deoxy-D-manno-octulosonic acid transferase [Parvularculaceae bacterium]|nr:3-deoxy-D-manno-octulosonic acid transferase [Parvularculaceae bacterium]
MTANAEIRLGEDAPLGLRLYRAVSLASEPLARFLLRRRLAQGREDQARIGERTGAPGRERPDGPLVWIHGASVGESLSVLPLVKRLAEERPALNFLVTTGTVTSARLMAERLPAGAIHQFIPIDLPRYVSGFLDHWRPDAAIFVESEFWPNLIMEARRHTKLLALVNGRVSPKSFNEWKRKPQTIRFLLSQFDLLIAQDNQNAERLSTLSGAQVAAFGNLKNAAPPLPADDDGMRQLTEQIGARPSWLAASTHPGEEEFIFDTHKMLKHDYPDILTVLAPRHPQRGAEVRDLALQSGLTALLRSSKGEITPDTDVYIADTLGELGLFYRMTQISFVGGSITEKGGHNPLEPARLGTAILHGPHVFNFVETYKEMRGGGGSALVRNERELATAVRRLMSDEKTRIAMSSSARNTADANAERVLKEVVKELLMRFESDKQAA